MASQTGPILQSIKSFLTQNGYSKTVRKLEEEAKKYEISLDTKDTSDLADLQVIFSKFQDKAQNEKIKLSDKASSE